MSERAPMTPTGFQKLSVELKHLKEVVRPQIVRDIEEARAHGDISENSEYEDAKERQSLTEGRIRELEDRIGRAEIIDITTIPYSDKMIFGATAEIEDLDEERSFTYRIVGSEEADASKGLVSYSSPIGRALIGRKTGDEFTFESPKGARTLLVNAIFYR